MASGKWLQGALQDLRDTKQSALELDGDLISGLVSFCELAPPLDAADYLKNIIGEDVGRDLIREYLRQRGHLDPFDLPGDSSNSPLQPCKEPAYGMTSAASVKKQTTALNAASQSSKPQPKAERSENAVRSKKKKGGKAISLAEAAKGSIVLKKGIPCSCQARRHKLVSNCLSCGKIVCEQEGEGPCSFCGALVLKEGSTYAGLDETSFPLSEAETVAEAFAKRLVDYDRNSAARTKVIDDQSDYYEIEGNSWLSAEEKESLHKQKEIQEAARAQKGKVIVTFDLVGRKVILNNDEVTELESQQSILRPDEEKDMNRIKPNPSVRVLPMFVDTVPTRKSDKQKQRVNGLCLEITGRVQHDGKDIQYAVSGRSKDDNVNNTQAFNDGEYECSLDYN